MNPNFEIACIAKETGINVEDIKKLRYKDLLTISSVFNKQSDNYFSTVGKAINKK